MFFFYNLPYVQCNLIVRLYVSNRVFHLQKVLLLFIASNENLDFWAFRFTASNCPSDVRQLILSRINVMITISEWTFPLDAISFLNRLLLISFFFALLCRFVVQWAWNRFSILTFSISHLIYPFALAFFALPFLWFWYFD